MAEYKVRKVEPGQTKIRDVPIAVTPEGFWCCPSQVVFQKTLKNQSQQTKHKPENPPATSKSSSKKISSPSSPETRVLPSPSRSRVSSEDQKCLNSSTSSTSPPVTLEGTLQPNGESHQRKISVGFGQPETSDLKVNLSGKEGIIVKMSVHSNILSEKSNFFADKLSRQSLVSCIEINDCEDVEIYVEAVGLMYCKEMKQRLMKQSVPRVLRILEAAELLGFGACIKSCLEYLEAVPWVGEEEENVIASVTHIKSDTCGINSILKRVSSDISSPPNATFSRIVEMVLKSNDERGRREMKSLMLKLLKENSLLTSGSADICVKTLYNSCQSCLNSLLASFRQAAEPGFLDDKSLGCKDPVMQQIVLEADNLLWLLEILADRRVADEFALMWATQAELAKLHPRLPIVSRHLVSCITARLFVGIGKGEMLPPKDTRQLLLHVWLQPLIEDYNWLQHGCRSFDRKVVEEGIGRTILTLPLDDQQTILLSWLGSFLKVGDSCPNLQRAFEVWWRRTFIRPFMEQQGARLRSDRN